METIESDTLSIKELLRRVKQELVESEKARLSEGESALFEVERLTLEINFVVTKNTRQRAGFDFKVITLGGDIEDNKQAIHKITLSLRTIPENERLTNSKASSPSNPSEDVSNSPRGYRPRMIGR